MRRSPWPCLLLLAACGMSDDEERQRVLTQLDRMHEIPGNHPGELRAAAEALAAVEVKNERTRQARDACVEMHLDRAKMFALKQELDAAVRERELKGDPKVLGQKFQQMDELQQNLGAKLERCSSRYSELLTAR